MVVHALSESPDDVDGMITALEGWTFEGPKGPMEIRAEDHALLQPMFQVDAATARLASLVGTLDPADVAPPVAAAP